MTPDGRTILFGLPGVGVRHVEHVAHHPLRSQLINVPARLARSARLLTLHLPAA